eukprot:CAMPEP_0114241938 /NCGR_PEP_ID=MMETSP0058-20121206/9898_1 /TAXON_ID=36894 /ORGANISM="Pyramimonas parkeae, CCMP726" /LENGTH=178 /DNA_ID=CAMNT_0001354495 /DNA_START=136 /DNA_END=672 /DNA_ORIENTATION=+
MADRKENEKVDRRSSKRKRQVAQGLRKVDSETRKQVAAARLDALENDNMVEQVDEDSDDYVVSSDEDEEEPAFRQPGKKGLSKPGVKKRKTRHANSHTRTKTKPFQTLLEEADLESMPVGSFNYLTAAAPPPKAYPPRFFCSICGFISPYTCTRCGARFCSKKCNHVHSETRCMKFTM